jgi:hypothetical protein
VYQAAPVASFVAEANSYYSHNYQEGLLHSSSTGILVVEDSLAAPGCSLGIRVRGKMGSGCTAAPNMIPAVVEMAGHRHNRESAGR